MSSTFSSILHSKLFTFKIGADETPLVVHSGTIATLSSPLDRLINGPFKEAQERVAHLHGLEIVDFERICEFAYTKHFNVTRTIRANTEKTYSQGTTYWAAIALDVNHRPPLSKCLPFAAKTWGTRKLKRANMSSSPRAKLDFKANGWQVMGLNAVSNGPVYVWDDSMEPWNDDVGQILTDYARLYIFAVQYIAADLRNYVLHKLHKYLMSLRLYDHTRSAFVELLEDLYNTDTDRAPGTIDETLKEPMDELCLLIIDFMIVMHPAFTDFPPFRELLRRGGEFGMDWYDRFANRFQELEEEQKDCAK